MVGGGSGGRDVGADRSMGFEFDPSRCAAAVFLLLLLLLLLLPLLEAAVPDVGGPRDA